MATITQEHTGTVVNRGHFEVPGPDESRIFPDGSSLVRARTIPWTPWALEGSEFQLLSVNRSSGL
ncbi:MAG: hypothetical protein WCY11_04955, partial [Novosphingobium sp.]